MDEYIKREAALVAITAEAEGYGFGTRDVLSGLYIAEDCVSKVPAADVAPVRHGRWIEGVDEAGFFDTCSICKKRFRIQLSRNYCPNCGGKMDEKETEE